MKKTTAQKLEQKRAAWVERTSQIMGMDEATTRALLDVGRKQSVRLNPLNGDVTATYTQLSQAATLGGSYRWAGDCYPVLDGVEALAASDAVSEGRAYIQNAASWLPVIALHPQPGEQVLDICAAPGGKTSHIAALTNNQAYITANDNSRPRLARMQANLERLGVQNVTYTLYDATQLARKLDGKQFDKILLDAPCSGEGLMCLSRDKDFATWSVAHIKRLQQLQKRIITQAWALLRPGGTLVYSTCTMTPEEDEAVVDYLLRSRRDIGDAAIVPFDVDLPNSMLPLRAWNGRPFSPGVQDCLRLAPSAQVEAFFVCKLHKTTPAA